MSKDQPVTAVVSTLNGSALLRPIASPTQLIERHKEITVLIKESLEFNKDYGPIPGTNEGKNVLLKPGAERLCVAFGCHPEYKTQAFDADHDRINKIVKYGKNETSIGFYRYVILCEVVRDGKIVGTGIGSCSTMESKYISRPRDVENTVLKMAQKRALVAAVLNTFALSNRFTQDMEKEDENEPDDEAADKKDGVIVYEGTVPEQDGLSKWLAETHPSIPEAKYFEIHCALKGQPKMKITQILKEIANV